MMWFTHVVFALLVSLISLKFFSPSSPELYIVLVCLGSILPDIDAPHSIINNQLKITKIAPLLFQHRGFFHSIFPVITIYAVLASIGWTGTALALSLGYFSHIVSDAFTVKGINIIHPIPGLRISGFMETGSVTEWIMFSVLVISTISLLI